MAGLDTQRIVRQRYSIAAQQREPALCCPIDYDTQYLQAIPQQVIDRDYGCGDPSKHVRRGETVLDLGSGGGKICFIAAQVVGPEGRVLGVDLNDVVDDEGRMYTRGETCDAALAAAAGREALADRFVVYEAVPPHAPASPAPPAGEPFPLPTTGAPCCPDDECC